MVINLYLIDIPSYFFGSENLAAQKSQSQSHINLKLCKQIIDEVKIGLWTIEQAQEKIQALEDNYSPPPQNVRRRPSVSLALIGRKSRLAQKILKLQTPYLIVL